MRAFRNRRGSAAVALSVAAVAAIGLTACSSSGAGSAGGGGKVAIVAYSVPKPAYDALQTAFKATDKGRSVSFSASYGASGDQSRAVANGQSADYVAFSIQPDMTKLTPDLVSADWNTGPTKGLVSDSVVVIAVRKGNPLGIKGWDDITKPGVKIVTPDPGSSGSAKWNLLAAFAHGYGNGGGEAGGEAYLKKFSANIVSKPESGSKATQTFLSGTGDVLISYENEAINARANKQALDYVVPEDSFLIQNPAAVTKQAGQAAKDFLAFVESEAGQKVFASKGYRPVLSGVNVGSVTGANDPANPFPAVRTLTTVSDLGGWSTVNTKYFDKTNGIITTILNSTG
ncbi:extracellular solute-binding protein [Jatrophihabitans telluris]|uniref:Extracellular solute-binding protein n=1 Tax=Jatrophihabitans telluris TaxID=2038343 RepID=A0ABY4QTW9_9ACTN|nr:extracellular solute-binding protein [Jatrophihabitans telluris]UQX86773.1 extracellular solute-binding protein [Jatrophihabitans telluris]